MKSGSYCLVITLMVVGLFLASSPASMADSMPHYATSSSSCPNYVHMVTGTHTGANPTFRLCIGSSNANYWQVSLKNPVTLQIAPNCQLPYQQAADNATFTCTVSAAGTPGTLPPGTWLASITYWIPGGGPITHAHYFYVAP